MESDLICYDQKTVTGLGDRLLDICSVMTQSPDSKFRVKWNLGKDHVRNTSYDTSLIKIENGEIVTYEEGSSSCNQNLDVKFPTRPGSSVPDENLKEEFRKSAKRIKPSQEVENVIPKETYVSVHIRGTDKFNDFNPDDPLGVSTDQYNYIKSKCIEYIKTHPNNTYLVCADDENLKREFMKDCGDEIRFIQINYGNLDKAIVDLFAISRSELVIQCTKYSTFSIVASLIGGIPLINYFDSGGVMGRDDWNWAPFLYGIVG
jgi:hypothetical protein